jgi:hypothetical protein
VKETQIGGQYGKLSEIIKRENAYGFLYNSPFRNSPLLIEKLIVISSEQADLLYTLMAFKETFIRSGLRSYRARR